jgi:formyl-CoA transferase
METNADGPLSGLRILELGHFVAAPFCTRVLADLGADIIKIEPPSGDPVRQWGQQIGGNSLWFSVHGRNKQSVTLNLKHKKAIPLLLRLIGRCDALVENYRPGQLAKFGLTPDALEQARPGLVVAHISGYGQNGPYRDRAAFGVIGEAIGGIRYLTNHAPGTTDLPPVRVGVSIGDSLAGLYAALGVMAALWKRDAGSGDRRGRDIDVALTESVLSLMEGLLPEYGKLGLIREPAGARINTAAPTSAYPTSDDKWLLIAANSDPLFAKLAAVMGQPALAADPRFLGNRLRVQHAAELDDIIGAWTKQATASDLDGRLTDADIPCTQVYTAADIAHDEQYRARGMVREIDDPLFGPVLHPGIVPHVSDDPGRVRWPGPAIGAHTEQVLSGLLGLTGADLDALRKEGVL